MKLPTTSLKNLSQRMDSSWKTLTSFENQMENWIKAMAPEGAREAGLNPACDIGETDDYFLIRFDIPGVRKEDLKIELDDNHLTITGERKAVHEVMEEDIDRYYLSETSCGTFVRRFTLPTGVTEEEVDASYADGVLSIAVRKIPDPHHTAEIKVN